MRLFYEDELRRKSYNEMYQIAVEEKLVDIYLENPTREELINILLKFRGARPDYSINKYNGNGIPMVQALFDDKLSVRIHHENEIKIPHMIILYKDLNLTREDNYKIIIPDKIGNANVFLVNANNYVCGIFNLEKDLEKNDEYYLMCKTEFLRVEKLRNNKFSFLFFKSDDLKYIYKFYNAREDDALPTYPYKLNYYKVDIENFEVRELEETSTVLCIDFGTSNTSRSLDSRNYSNFKKCPFG